MAQKLFEANDGAVLFLGFVASFGQSCGWLPWFLQEKSEEEERKHQMIRSSCCSVACTTHLWLWVSRTSKSARKGRGGWSLCPAGGVQSSLAPSLSRIRCPARPVGAPLRRRQRVRASVEPLFRSWRPAAPSPYKEDEFMELLLGGCRRRLALWMPEQWSKFNHQGADSIVKWCFSNFWPLEEAIIASPGSWKSQKPPQTGT